MPKGLMRDCADSHGATSFRAEVEPSCLQEIQPYEAPDASCPTGRLGASARAGAMGRLCDMIQAGSSACDASAAAGPSEALFGVNCLRDSSGLLPVKVLLGVSQQGVSMRRLLSHELLHSVSLRDVIQFGCSSTTACLDLHLWGEAHALHFQTGQGEEICGALQAHIDRRLKRRRSKLQGLDHINSLQSGAAAAAASFLDRKAARLQPDSGRTWLDDAVRSPLARSRRLAIGSSEETSAITVGALCRPSAARLAVHSPPARTRRQLPNERLADARPAADLAAGPGHAWHDDGMRRISPSARSRRLASRSPADALAVDAGAFSGSSCRRPPDQWLPVSSGNDDRAASSQATGSSGEGHASQHGRQPAGGTNQPVALAGGVVAGHRLKGSARCVPAGDEAGTAGRQAKEAGSMATRVAGTSNSSVSVEPAAPHAASRGGQAVHGGSWSHQKEAPARPPQQQQSPLQEVTHLCQPVSLPPPRSLCPKDMVPGKPAASGRVDEPSALTAPAAQPRTQAVETAAYAVNRLQDSTGRLPVKVLLRIDKYGVHFSSLMPPQEHLFTTKLRDVVQYGCGSATVCLDVRSLSGEAHALHFQTGQGEEICGELAAHIDRRLKRRRSKQQGQGAACAAPGPRWQRPLRPDCARRRHSQGSMQEPICDTMP